MSGKALLNAGIAKQIDFVPIPGGGSQAALKGAPITYLVGQSLISQWTITAHASIKTVQDLKGKIIGLGRPGSADYDEADIVLSKNFGMEPGRDYKVISFRGEAERIAAMINGDIHAGLLTFPHAAKAKLAGFKVILKTGKYLPRIGGSFWVHNDFLKANRATAKAFIHAMAEACRVHEEQQGRIRRRHPEVLRHEGPQGSRRGLGGSVRPVRSGHARGPGQEPLRVPGQAHDGEEPLAQGQAPPGRREVRRQRPAERDPERAGLLPAAEAAVEGVSEAVRQDRFIGGAGCRAPDA